MFIRLVIRAPFICIGAIAMAMILDLKLAQILLAAVPLFVLVLYLIVRASSPLYARYQRQLDRLAALVRENLSGVRVIRAFARRDHEEARFAGANGELNRTANRVGRISALLSPVTAAIMNGVILLVLWTGGRRIQLGSFTQGETIAFINYVTQILLALVVVSNLVVIFTRAFASAGRINELLAVIPAIADGPGAQPDPAAAAVEFQDVSFAYSATGDLALEHISFAAGLGGAGGHHRAHGLRQVDAGAADRPALRRNRGQRAGDGRGCAAIRPAAAAGAGGDRAPARRAVRRNGGG